MLYGIAAMLLGLIAIFAGKAMKKMNEKNMQKYEERKRQREEAKKQKES